MNSMNSMNSMGDSELHGGLNSMGDSGLNSMGDSASFNQDGLRRACRMHELHGGQCFVQSGWTAA